MLPPVEASELPASTLDDPTARYLPSTPVLPILPKVAIRNMLAILPRVAHRDIHNQMLMDLVVAAMVLLLLLLQLLPLMPPPRTIGHQAWQRSPARVVPRPS